MIRVQDLKKQYATETGFVDAIRGVSMTVQPGEIYTLLGPSGCGKSTMLRSIAGLERPNAGTITVAEDQVVFSLVEGIDVPTHRRGVGMVFQSYAIWPHLTVFENVAFPLRYGSFKVPKSQVRDMVMRTLESVQLAEFADRPSPLLSGGQQQRVALARALVYEPTILLLDEPLSNLDAQLRKEMRSEIAALIKHLGVTALYVTHDQEEALAISDRIAVMKDGLIQQEGIPDEVYTYPATVFVAQFVGKSNFMKGRVTQVTRDMIRTACGNSVISSWHHSGFSHLKVGDEVQISIRPGDVELHHNQTTLRPNSFPAEVEKVTFLGGSRHTIIRAGEIGLEAESHGRSRFAVGDRVYVELPADSIRLFSSTEPATQTASPSQNAVLDNMEHQRGLELG